MEPCKPIKFSELEPCKKGFEPITAEAYEKCVNERREV